MSKGNASRSIILGGLLLLNIVLLGSSFALRDRVNVYQIGDEFPTLAGAGREGTMLSANNQPCYLIRVTMDDCEFCRSDQSAYDKLSEAAASSSCQIVEVSPVAGQISGVRPKGFALFEFVDMDLAGALQSVATPQTIVLDHERRVVWRKVGAFDAGSLSEAIDAVKSLSPDPD